MNLREVAVSAVGGALYALLGYVSWLGLTFYGVRFWPAVVIPAVLSCLYGGRVGGLSAAIGIFLSDVATHGNALLSLSVGVTSNFACFYLMGRLAGGERYSLRRYLAASTLSLIVGHLIIGFGLLLWSQYFPMPFQTSLTPLSLTAALTISFVTFAWELPFVLILVPPIVRAVRRA
ncbi:MAG: ECF transporter S component [Candidatus Korarchaeota archaeon NZ13-K]|nr:MAG: ECF transporter S component [Candidatus Korarchaeota archaeon NZ13-K]